jgi:hypothetical protein
MIQTFDIFNRPETPTFILCNPNKTQLYAMGEIYNTDIILRYNGLSEFKFTVCSKINGNIVPYFDTIAYRRLVLIDGVGYFIIDSIDEENNGVINLKNVVCKSLESELIYKQLSLTGTYNFYDGVATTDLMHKILSYAPGWSIGTIDPNLWNVFRTFDISKNTLYNLMMTDLSNTYECIFTFDTFNKTISATSATTATTNTDIYLSYDNLVKNINLKPITNELVTALDVTGGGDLSINVVNPIGTDTIYNFAYYKNNEWMGDSLIDAIDAWELKIDSYLGAYGDILAAYKQSNIDLLDLQATLSILNSQKITMEGVQAVRVQGGVPMTNAYTYVDNSVVPSTERIYPDGQGLTAALAFNSGQIIAQESLIANKQTTIDDQKTQLAAINSDLSFANNFTEEQFLELDSYIITSSYQNENFIQTSLMTPSEIQDQAQDLYDQAIAVLAKISNPRYEFSIDSANFIFLKEYITFTNQLQLGSVINLEISDSVMAYPVLLQIEFSYDDPTKFNLVFSNRLRLDNSNYEFSDLFGSTNNSGLSVDFNSQQWKEWTNNYQDDVSLFINSSLNAANNNIISSANQEIVINQNGIKGRKVLEDGSYDLKQFWMNNNVLAFTDDNWETSSLALGEITTPGGSTAYGLSADAIFGRLLVSNALTVSNANNSFIVNASGATLKNSQFALTRSGITGEKTIIMLAPGSVDIGAPFIGYTGGLGIADIDGVKKFYADLNGNVTFSGVLSGATGNFSGTITANSGTIGGLVIESTGIKQYNYGNLNNYINNDGTAKIGGLTISSDKSEFIGSGTFSGAIIAKSGELGGWTIDSNGLFDANSGNYIYKNNIKLGALTINGSTSTFAGTFNATQINGLITGSQIAANTITDGNMGDISANKITAGTMSADRISAGTFSGSSFSWGDAYNGTGLLSYSNTSPTGLKITASDGSVSVASLTLRHQNSNASIVIGKNGITMSGSIGVLGTVIDGGSYYDGISGKYVGLSLYGSITNSVVPITIASRTTFYDGAQFGSPSGAPVFAGGNLVEFYNLARFYASTTFFNTTTFSSSTAFRGNAFFLGYATFYENTYLRGYTMVYGNLAAQDGSGTLQMGWTGDLHLVGGTTLRIAKGLIYASY